LAVAQHRRTINGADLGDILVRSQHALDWPLLLEGQVSAAHDGTERGRGIRVGTYAEPWQYRAPFK